MRKTFTLIICLVSFITQSQGIRDTLLVAYTPAAPFIVEDGPKLQGLNVWLWRQIAEDLELAYKLVPMDFSNMLDSLRTGGIDLSINPLSITSDRSREMEFTHSFFASNATAVVAEVSSLKKFIYFLKGFLI